MKSILRWAMLLVLFSLLSACASKPQLPRILWPAPPEEPKLEWMGVYYNDENFPSTSGERSLKVLERGPEFFIFKSPFDIASNGRGLVYLTDLHHRKVFVFDFNRRGVSSLFRNQQITAPTGIAVDSQGTLYISDANDGKVWISSPAGIISKVIDSPDQLSRPSYLGLDEQRQRIYVSDTALHQVVAFDFNGTYLFSIGEQGRAEGQFYVPQGIAVDKNGDIFVADMLNARIQVFNSQGQFQRTFGERGDQVYQFENPKGLAFDSEGNLHVTDTRKGLLLSYRPDGRLLLSTGGEGRTEHPLGFSLPKGIYVDQNDMIYVADQLNRRFSTYQYLSEQVLQKNPITEEDKRKLQEFLQQTELR